MAPLIDITFQLIVFFMLVSDMSARQSEDLHLPNASMARVTAGPETVVNVLADGRVKIGGRTHSDGALEALFESQKGKDLPVLIRADRSAPFESIQKIMMIASDRGNVERLRFAAIKE